MQSFDRRVCKSNEVFDLRTRAGKYSVVTPTQLQARAKQSSKKVASAASGVELPLSEAKLQAAMEPCKFGLCNFIHRTPLMLAYEVMAAHFPYASS